MPVGLDRFPGETHGRWQAKSSPFVCPRKKEGFMKYRVEQVKASLGSVQHILGSFQFGLRLMKDTDLLDEKFLLEMQKAVNEDFKRLRKGEIPIVAFNHAQTRKGVQHGKK